MIYPIKYAAFLFLPFSLRSIMPRLDTPPFAYSFHVTYWERDDGLTEGAHYTQESNKQKQCEKRPRSPSSRSVWFCSTPPSASLSPRESAMKTLQRPNRTHRSLLAQHLQVRSAVVLRPLENRSDVLSRQRRALPLQVDREQLVPRLLVRKRDLLVTRAQHYIDASCQSANHCVIQFERTIGCTDYQNALFSTSHHAAFPTRSSPRRPAGSWTRSSVVCWPRFRCRYIEVLSLRHLRAFRIESISSMNTIDGWFL